MEQELEFVTTIAQNALQLLGAIQVLTDVFCRYSQLMASSAAF